jgi:nitrile hydratase subunit beta
MDGVHDLGGMDGFGAIHAERDEPVFHEPWEGRVYALNTAMGARGVWNIDVGRFAIESLPPRTYLTSTYYERWLAKLERLLSTYSTVLDQGTTLTADDVGRVLARGSYVRPATAAARFAAGDRVRARNLHPRSHTRLPRYVRGHTGVIDEVHRPNVFPDSVVRGDGEQPQWLYTVEFEGRELWGDDAELGTRVSVNAFEPYLEPA